MIIVKLYVYAVFLVVVFLNHNCSNLKKLLELLQKDAKENSIPLGRHFN